MIRLTLVCAAIAMPCAVQRASTQLETPPAQNVAIGIVRADGMLFPLAQLHDDVWTPLSRHNSEGTTSHLTNAGRRLAGEVWKAFPINGAASFPLTVRGVSTVDSHCTRTEAIRTDAPKRPFPQRTFPAPKTAIAVSGSATALSIESLRPPYDGAARRITRVVVSVTQAFERERTDAAANSPLAKYTAAERSRVSVQITALVRNATVVGNAYYFEARKRYTAGLELRVSGWITDSAGEIQLRNVRGALDEDGRNVETSQVLGAVTLRDRTVWVLEAHGYESEAYDLIEFVASEPFRRAIRIAGGGC